MTLLSKLILNISSMYLNKIQAMPYFPKTFQKVTKHFKANETYTRTICCIKKYQKNGIKDQDRFLIVYFL